LIKKGGSKAALRFSASYSHLRGGFSRRNIVAQDQSVPSPFITGMKGLCPRCGKGHLFKGFLAVRPSCEVCGLDFAFADAGDGPAFFVMSAVGIIVIALALWVEFAYSPPIWLHLVLWSALSVILSLALVRPSKGLLVALQYHHKAEEGRFEK
jgi:uncharacterized protein (DUF983 family)